MYTIAARVRTIAPRKLTSYAKSQAGHAVLWMLARAILAAQGVA